MAIDSCRGGNNNLIACVVVFLFNLFLFQRVRVGVPPECTCAPDSKDSSEACSSTSTIGESSSSSS
jgi:hypothetical protein